MKKLSFFFEATSIPYVLHINLMRKNIPNINYLILLIIKFLRVILAHVKMEVNVQMLEIHSSVNVLLVIAENNVRIKVHTKKSVFLLWKLAYLSCNLQ